MRMTDTVIAMDFFLDIGTPSFGRRILTIIIHLFVLKNNPPKYNRGGRLAAPKDLTGYEEIAYIFMYDVFAAPVRTKRSSPKNRGRCPYAGMISQRMDLV
jgi:hypothetical protein